MSSCVAKSFFEDLTLRIRLAIDSWYRSEVEAGPVMHRRRRRWWRMRMQADCDILGKDTLILITPLPSLPSKVDLKSPDLLRPHGYRLRLASAFEPPADQNFSISLIQFLL